MSNKPAYLGRLLLIDMLLVGLFGLLGIWMLDSQTPNVEVVTNIDYHIHNEAAVDAKSKPDAREEKSHLVDAVTERAIPSNANVLEENWSDGVNDSVRERQCQHVLVWKRRLCQMSCNHLTDTVSIDHSGVQYKGHDVLSEDDGL